MIPSLRKLLFETLYKNRYLYRFASTIPFAGQWRVWQRLVLTRLHGTIVLEIGCGLGDLLADMLEAGYECRAIEHSPQMVAAARDTLHKRGRGNDATIIQGSAQALPFSAETFDSVVSTFPSEYIYDPDSLSEIARVLRPGGRLIVIEGANLLPVGFVQPILVFLQSLIYGPAALYGPRKKRNLSEEKARQRGEKDPEERALHTTRETLAGTTSTIIPNAWFGQHIPLEQVGLRRRSERVRSPRWEVYITIGDKI
ncbi:MAG TPA: class I SAM-dependent methyltransferase [Ktedonobacteraceae bacterium]|jgi:SAM-dependent methyltransferase